MDTQQRILLEYYHRKSVNSLGNTETRYQNYATSLSDECNIIRNDIKDIYVYLNEAQVFLTNAQVAQNKLSHQLKVVQSGKTIGNPEWCNLDDDSDDEYTITINKV